VHDLPLTEEPIIQHFLLGVADCSCVEADGGPVDAAAQLPELQRRPEPGIVLVGDIGTMRRLVDQADGRIRAVNVGGVHFSPGRVQRLRFVFLTPAEEQGLRDIADLGVEVSAQDVPSARPVPLGELLASTAGA
jgi:PTS system mannose-specific IIB component/fructoselysine and glucoselysine-specific PTS system IIB component